MATPKSHLTRNVACATTLYAMPPVAEIDGDLLSHTRHLDTMTEGAASIHNAPMLQARRKFCKHLYEAGGITKDKMVQVRKHNYNHSRRLITDKNVQVLSLSVIRAMEAKEIYDVLGLAIIGAIGQFQSRPAHRDTANMLEAITRMLPKVDLPLDWTEAATFAEGKRYMTVLEEQVKAVLSKYGTIWERGPRRASNSDLYLDVPDDLTSIKKGLKAYIVKRAMYRRVKFMKLARSEAGNIIDGSRVSGNDDSSRMSPFSSNNEASLSSTERGEAVVPEGQTMSSEEDENSSILIASENRISSSPRPVVDDSSPSACINSSSSNPGPNHIIDATVIIPTSPTLPALKQEGDSHGDITPEKVWVLQQTAFDQLLAILQASDTQDASLMQFDNHVRDIHCPMVHERMKLSLGNRRLSSAVEAYNMWSRMHEELRQFRVATKYTGKADGWTAHKQTLRAVSWKEVYVPALNAHRQLGLFVMETKKREEWPLTEDDFAAQLADYHATLLEAPAVQPEDLVDGFKEYNVELLAWFQL
ncbi:hypothetical protein FB567DRAFT_616619 [Paraphoma chrysanthemicola]|uniref:Uncharacterized protein n=1 Tax=Paraphoma chrysanthemicola TaxID=798071 RepID=A0A8K0W122_9PLEO|nr:hypothetical protein FB567DRAFT_616619 [Paraphoma chrysanthemicola]